LNKFKNKQAKLPKSSKVTCDSEKMKLSEEKLKSLEWSAKCRRWKQYRLSSRKSNLPKRNASCNSVKIPYLRPSNSKTKRLTNLESADNKRLQTTLLTKNAFAKKSATLKKCLPMLVKYLSKKTSVEALRIGWLELKWRIRSQS
jgi:hypothetical protein